MQAKRYQRGAAVLLAIVTASCGTQDGGSKSETLPAPVSSVSIAPSVTAHSTTSETVDLDGVVPASVPIVVAEHLGAVVQAIRAEVGDAVFGGSAVQNGDRPDVTMTIFGTNSEALTTALSRIDTAYRDRFTVVETIYSVSDIETFADEAHRRLAGAGIEAAVIVQFGLDAVPVFLETPDGEPDERLQRKVFDLLGDIPVEISFHGPMMDLFRAAAPTG